MTFKRKDIESCILCDRGVMHDNNMVFTRITLEAFVINLPAVRRMHGLEMMLGSPALAHVMGQDEDVAKSVDGQVFALVCLECRMKPVSIDGLLERIETRAEEVIKAEGAADGR